MNGDAKTFRSKIIVRRTMGVTIGDTENIVVNRLYHNYPYYCLRLPRPNIPLLLAYGRPWIYRISLWYLRTDAFGMLSSKSSEIELYSPTVVSIAEMTA